MIYLILIGITLAILCASASVLLYTRRVYNQTFKAVVGGHVVEAECSYKYARLFIDGILADKFDGMQLHSAKLTCDAPFGRVKINITYSMRGYRCAAFFNDGEIPFEKIDRNKTEREKRRAARAERAKSKRIEKDRNDAD